MYSGENLKIDTLFPTKVFINALITALGYVVVQLDVTIVNVALPTFSRVFDADISILQWIPDAYVIVFAALLLAAGGLSDKYGSKNINLAGIGLFLLASLLCALSPSLNLMILGRVFQGVGAALIVPSSLSLLTGACGDNSSLRRKAIGWWSAIGGVISAAGPFFGGLILKHISWHALFLLNIPICMVGIILTMFYVHEPATPRMRNIDHKGILLFVITSFSLIYLLIQFGKSYAFTQTLLLCLGIFAFACIMLIVHIKNSVNAFLPLSLLRNQIFSLSLLLGAIMNLAFYGSIFLLTVYFQVYRGFSPLMTGLALLTFAVIALANTASSAISERIGVRLTIVIGLLIATINYSSLALLTYTDASYKTFVGFLFLMTLGGGIATPAIIASCLYQAPPNKAATASAVINAMRQTGAAVGVALLGILVTGTHFSINIGASVGFAIAAVIMFCAALVVFTSFIMPTAISDDT
ncbi:MFS transporter [Serratia sp. M24T3]|uniref:MFS transporter n=1 Tax=Serratia sp. M24T3 TaxID=932213 RepID=UPI00025BAEFA|nr:MFS transporter [Serratia sp. M24T3]EIC86224.1 putative multidrug resistance transporter protein [Serratia sp. M24T3]